MGQVLMILIMVFFSLLAWFKTSIFSFFSCRLSEIFFLPLQEASSIYHSRPMRNRGVSIHGPQNSQLFSCCRRATQLELNLSFTPLLWTAWSIHLDVWVADTSSI